MKSLKMTYANIPAITDEELVANTKYDIFGQVPDYLKIVVTGDKEYFVVNEQDGTEVPFDSRHQMLLYIMEFTVIDLYNRA